MPTAADSTIVFEVVSVVGGLLSTTGFLTWWIGRQFSDNRKVFYRVISKHNREDDDRFALLQGSINQIHLRNAVRDGREPPDLREIPRRRYLSADGDGDEESSE